MNKNFKVKTRTLEEYNLIMGLKKENNKLGIIKLSKLANIPKDTIRDWIYRGVKPKRLRKTKLLPESSKKLTPELAYILGVLKGDGCICKSKRYSLPGECFEYCLILGVTDKDFAEYFANQVKIWSGFTPYISVRNPRGKGKKNVFTARVRSKDMYGFLFSFDLNEIKNASKDIKSMFLKGFYDSESHVNIKNRGIHIGVVDKEVIILAKYLLQSIGIKCADIKEKTLESKKIFYYFGIYTSKDLLKFNKLVNFSIKRKQEYLKKLIDLHDCKGVVDRKKKRQQNKILVYNTIKNNSGLSNYKLSQKLELTEVKTKKLVNDLLKENKIIQKNLPEKKANSVFFIA